MVWSDGPWDSLSRLRHKLGVRYTELGRQYGLNVVGKALSCPICASFWVGVLLTVIALLDVRIIYPLVALGLVVLLTEVTDAHSG